MSTGIVITIVVIAAVVFGAIVVLTTARSSEVRGAGALSRETRSRDRKEQSLAAHLLDAK